MEEPNQATREAMIEARSMIKSDVPYTPIAELSPENEQQVRLWLEKDDVNHPAHYNQGKIECIDAIKEMLGPAGFEAYLRGNIFKYNWRLMHKGKPLRDAQKAGWYLERLKQELAGRE